MKVLWCTNTVLSDNRHGSGNWMLMMLENISSLHPEIEFHIFGIANVTDIQEGRFRNFRQVIFPDYPLKENGLPSAVVVEKLRHFISELNPDLIHIWGLEKYWGALSVSLQMHYKVLLEVQGIKRLCVEPFLGGLPRKIFYRYAGIPELLYPWSFPVTQRRKFENDGIIEREVIKQNSYINTQSQFVRNYIKSLNAPAKIFETGIILRSEITNTSPWIEPPQENCTQIFSVASAVPYKAAHVTIKAFAVLKKKIPNIHLKIAGIHVNNNPIKNSVYVRYILNLIKTLGISDSVTLPGVMDAEQIIEEYKKSKVFVISSFIETYCLALAEALYVGMPCIASDISALKEFQPSGNELSLLYYEKGNYLDLSKKFEVVLENKVLRQSLSVNARNDAFLRNDAQKIAMNQYKIYQNILNE